MIVECSCSVEVGENTIFWHPTEILRKCCTKQQAVLPSFVVDHPPDETKKAWQWSHISLATETSIARMTCGHFLPDNNNDESSGDDGADSVATPTWETSKNSDDDASLLPKLLELLEINCTEDLSHFVSKEDITELTHLGNQEKPPWKGDWIDISDEDNDFVQK